MFPIIECGLFQIQTFSVVLLAAFFITILAGVKSQQNDILAVRWLIQKLLIILVAAGICGRLVSVVIMMAQEKLTFAYCFIHGGFVYYGALTGGMTAGALLCIHDRKNILEMTDIALSSLPLGQAIGRLGCYLNGCCYGRETSSYFSVMYPVNGMPVRVYPTWFMESFCCFVLWYFLAHIKMRHSGETTAIYLIAYGIIRYIIEWFRGDLVRGVFGRLSTSQAFSAVAVIGGISILFYLRKRKGKITHGFPEEIP